MGKFFETSSIFNYSWEQLAKAFWKRYPNPYSTHVLSEDTLVREVRGDQLYSKRLLVKTNRLPKWGETFVKSRETSVVEESYVNPNTKTITTYTRNIGFTKVMTVVEKVVYKPDPENPQIKTMAHREAWIDSNLYGFRRAVESFGVKRYQKNCLQATQGFSFVLQSIYASPSNKKVESNVVTAYPETEGSMKDKARQRIRDLARKKGAMGSVSVYAAPSNEPKNQS